MKITQDIHQSYLLGMIENSVHLWVFSTIITDLLIELTLLFYLQQCGHQLEH